MEAWWWIAAGLAFAFALGAALLWKPLALRLREQHYARLRNEFHRQREWLEVHFFKAAAASGKPRGLRWVECDFDDGVTYARDRQSGALCAFVSVTIGFEAIEGQGMEEVEAVANLRAATAVFRLERPRRGGYKWGTDGRAIFNLNPTEAVAHFGEQLVLVGHDAKRS